MFSTNLLRYCTSFLGYLSLMASNKKEPIPLPVPPAMEWISTKPSSQIRIVSLLVGMGCRSYCFLESKSLKCPNSFLGLKSLLWFQYTETNLYWDQCYKFDMFFRLFKEVFFHVASLSFRPNYRCHQPHGPPYRRLPGKTGAFGSQQKLGPSKLGANLLKVW